MLQQEKAMLLQYVMAGGRSGGWGVGGGVAVVVWVWCERVNICCVGERGFL